MTSVRRAGFTLIEAILVVALVAVVASLAVAAYGGVGAAADERAVLAECAVIREACLRFRADTGRAPRYVAELMQEPSTWSWCAEADRPGAWDDALRRGWNGPYLLGELPSGDAVPTEEARLRADGAYEVQVSSATQALGILTSEYPSFPQDATGRRRSHFQLEEWKDGAGTSWLRVRFVRDPAAPAPGATVCSLPTGLRP